MSKSKPAPVKTKKPVPTKGQNRAKSGKGKPASQDNGNENIDSSMDFLFLDNSPQSKEDEWFSKIEALVKKKKTLPVTTRFSDTLEYTYDALLKELCTRCGEKFSPMFSCDNEKQHETLVRENIEDVHTKELENKLSSRESDLSELKKSKEEVEKKLTAVIDEKTKLNETIKKYQSEEKKMKSELTELKDKMKELEKRKEEKEVPIVKNIEETNPDNNLQNKMRTLEEQTKTMKNNFQKEKDDLNDKFHKLKEDNLTIKQQLDEKIKLHNKEYSQRTMVEKENEELKKKLSNLEKGLNELQSNNSAQSTQHNTNKDQIIRLTNENERLKLSEKKSKEGLETKEKEIKRWEDAQNVLKAEKESLQDLLNDIKSQVRQEVDHHTKKTDSIYQNLKSKEHEILDLKRTLSDIERSKASLQKQLEEQNSTSKRKKNTTKAPNQAVKDLQEENEKLRDRLSQVAGSKLTDGNPAIADLGDPNRPTQLGEKFSELYDNEWTDAMEELGNAGDEKSNITTLRNIVEKSYDFGKIKSEKYAQGLEGALLEISNSIEVTPTISKYIKDHRKNTALLVVDALYKSFLSSHTEFNVGGTDVKTFIKKTLSLCWLMTIQDPPVILTTELSGKFNTDLFRHYTKSGSNVDYVVWPVVFLHEGGPIICKGVAQGK